MDNGAVLKASFSLADAVDIFQSRFEDGFEDGNDQTRILVTDLAEYLQAQQRRLFESFKGGATGTDLVVDLVESMSAQERRVIGMKQFIQQYRAGH